MCVEPFGPPSVSPHTVVGLPSRTVLRGQMSSEHTYVWQLSCASQILIRGPLYWHLSWFVSTLTMKKQDSWQVCSVTERSDQPGEVGEVKGGGADMRIKEWGLPAIFSAFIAPKHRNSHAQSPANNIKIKCRHTLALVTANMVCQCAAFSTCFVKWKRRFMIGFTTEFALAKTISFCLHCCDLSWQTVAGQWVDSNAMQRWWQ